MELVSGDERSYKPDLLVAELPKMLEAHHSSLEDKQKPPTKQIEGLPVTVDILCYPSLFDGR